MWRSVSASINCTETRTWFPDLRTLPSTTLLTPSCCAISLRLRVMPLLYCMTEVRLITFKSLILARFESNSSWMPSAKYAFAVQLLWTHINQRAASSLLYRQFAHRIAQATRDPEVGDL